MTEEPGGEIAGEANNDLITSSHNVLLKTLDLFLRTIEHWWKENGKRTCPLLHLFTWFQKVPSAKGLLKGGDSKGCSPDPNTLGFRLWTPQTDSWWELPVQAWMQTVACGRWQSEDTERDAGDLLRVEMPFYPRESLGSTEVRTCPGQPSICFPGRRNASIL